MQFPDDEILLASCLKKIETQLNWGESIDWTNRDFELLSEQIAGKTGVTLSIVTLKRIWGRIRYDNKPTQTTLNTLAKFIGYAEWRCFKQAYIGLADRIGIDPMQQARAEKMDHTGEKRNRYFPAMGIGVLLFMGLLFYFILYKQIAAANLNPEYYDFSSKTTVTDGLPNSVVFEYDAKRAKATDTVRIQQSWDKRLSQVVSRTGNRHTSIYYYPGFFRAKLTVNGQIMAEHDIAIKTHGWLPMIEQATVPVYLAEADARRDNKFGLPLTVLEKNHIPLQPETPWVSYCQVKEFDSSLLTDNFILETKIRNEYKEGAAACQNAVIQILCENGALVIPLSNKGCSSDLNLYLINKPVSGKTNDLSAFGTDMSDWVVLKCKVVDKMMNVYINNILVYQKKFTANASIIEGLRYRFQGTGSIAYVRLTKPNGKISYEENFSGQPIAE
jgi:hypothetical protein